MRHSANKLINYISAERKRSGWEEKFTTTIRCEDVKFIGLKSHPDKKHPISHESIDVKYRRSDGRNFLARSAVNRKVGGSIPPEDDLSFLTVL